MQHAVLLLLAQGIERELTYIDLVDEPRSLAGGFLFAPLHESALFGAA